MTPLVVDASVVFKWFFPEQNADIAKSLLTRGRQLLAPELLWTEVANIIWKSHRKRLVSLLDAESMLADIPGFPVTLHECGPLLIPAFRIAVQHDRTIYDSLYVALAEREGATLVTDDRRLVNSLANSVHAARVSFLTDL